MGAQAREPGGRPTGGRFATGVRAEPGIALPTEPAALAQDELDLARWEEDDELAALAWEQGPRGAQPMR